MRQVRSGLLFIASGHPDAAPWGPWCTTLPRLAKAVANGPVSGRKASQRGLAREMRAGRWSATVLDYHYPERAPVKLSARRVRPGVWSLIAA